MIIATKVVVAIREAIKELFGLSTPRLLRSFMSIIPPSRRLLLLSLQDLR